MIAENLYVKHDNDMYYCTKPGVTKRFDYKLSLLEKDKMTIEELQRFDVMCKLSNISIPYLSVSQYKTLLGLDYALVRVCKYSYCKLDTYERVSREYLSYILNSIKDLSTICIYKYKIDKRNYYNPNYNSIIAKRRKTIKDKKAFLEKSQDFAYIYKTNVTMSRNIVIEAIQNYCREKNLTFPVTLNNCFYIKAISKEQILKMKNNEREN